MLSSYIIGFLKRCKTHISKNDKLDIFMVCFGLALFIYTAIMAYVSDITPDEAYTYLAYANGNNPGFLRIDFANNHPLNSFLIYVSSFLFPFNEFAIRFPNLIFLLIYLWIAIRVSKIFKPYGLVIFGGLTLFWVLIPEFFSMARGYGIASALVLIFCFRLYTKDSHNKNFIVNLYLLMLGCYAYPGLLPLPVAYVLYYVIFELKFKIFFLLKSYVFDLFFQLGNFVFLAYFLLSVSVEGKPLFGSEKETFIEATVGWYLNSFNAIGLHVEGVLLIVLFAFLLLASFFIIYANKNNSQITRITIITFSLFFIISYMLHKPYPTGRLLLPLYPLLILSIGEGIRYVNTKFSIKTGHIKIFSVTFFILIAINFAMQFKLKNNNSNYKEKALKSLSSTVLVNNHGNSSLEFYRAKYLSNYPIKNIIDDPSAVTMDVSKKMKSYYSRSKNILLLEAKSGFDTNPRFFLHVTPADSASLSEERKESGFDNLDFQWSGFRKKFKNYMVISLPDYDINTITIGQIENNDRLWGSVLNIAERM